jgi:arylsulfatase A-like enzyme
MPQTRRQLLASLAITPVLKAAARRPNIVVILADDLGFADLGFQGCRDIRTPHLDGMVRSGVRFENGYCSHPFCSPTRAGLLTGRYQHRFGHENNMVFDLEDNQAGLPLTERTLADVLGKAGYATGLVGKWHLGASPRFHPFRRGFQEMYGFVGGGHDYFDPGKPGDKRQHLIPVERAGKPVAEKEYLTTALGREAAAFVRRHAKDPFFLYLAFNAPHTPLQAPESYIARYKSIADPKRRTYAAMVTAMDDAIGATLKAVSESGLDNDTLVFFLSDNGGPSGNSSSNSPLRGTKRTVYEGGIRVPFAVRWTGRLKAGMYTNPVISLDVFPTALAAAGVAAPPERPLDGVNLLPFLEGKGGTTPHERLFWRMFGGDFAAVREGRYKLVRSKGKPDELFDLQQDAGEQRDLSPSKPEIAKKLRSSLDQWHSKMAKPLWPDHIYHSHLLDPKKLELSKQ